MNNSISKNSKLFQRLKSADYEVDREGLIKLKDEKSIEKKVIKLLKKRVWYYTPNQRNLSVV